LAVLEAASPFISKTPTSAPSLANAKTIPRPIPAPPPVTTPTLPFKRIPFLLSRIRDYGLNPQVQICLATRKPYWPVAAISFPH
jgi:hypothetical protein